MSRLTIDLGTAGNSATGDSIRAAFEKVNTNFSELYAELGGDSLDTLSFSNNTISSGVTNGTLVLTGNGTGAVDIEGIQINDNQIITTTSNTNLLLDGNGTGTVVINGLSFPIADGTAGQVLKTDGAGNLSFTAVDPGAITIVGDDSTGTAVNIGETFKIAGTQNITTAVSGDTVTITGPDLSSYLTSVPKIIDVNEISSSDSSAIQINDAINVSGALTANVINVGNTSGINFDGGSGGSYYAGQSGVPEASINKAGAYRTESSATNSLFTFGANGSGTMSVSVEGSMFIGTAMPSNNGGLSTAYSGWLVVQSGGKFGGDINTLGALKFDHSTNGYVQFYDGTVQSTARAMTIVGDDSTGTAVNIGETFRIAGAGTVTTAVSGDTLTITGSSSPTLNVLKIDDGVHEKFQTKADATGTVTHDCSAGHIFFHTSPDANWTANFTNLNLDSGYATAVSLVIVQGGTGYYPNAVEIGGVGQTINWQGNATPTPSTNRTDVVTFSILNNSGTYVVLGQLTGF